MPLIDTAAACFAELGWEMRRVEQFPVLSTSVDAPNGAQELFVHAHEDKQRLLVYVRPRGLEIEDDRLPALADFLMRANYGLALGNFELDMNDGEMNFKNSVDVTGGALTELMVKTLVVFAIETTNRYLPGMRAVLAGTSPKDAIEAIDGPSRIVIT